MLIQHLFNIVETILACLLTGRWKREGAKKENAWENNAHRAESNFVPAAKSSHLNVDGISHFMGLVDLFVCPTPAVACYVNERWRHSILETKFVLKDKKHSYLNPSS